LENPVPSSGSRSALESLWEPPPSPWVRWVFDVKNNDKTEIILEKLILMISLKQ
jgi:hypothetical protein